MATYNPPDYQPNQQNPPIEEITQSYVPPQPPMNPNPQMNIPPPEQQAQWAQQYPQMSVPPQVEGYQQYQNQSPFSQPPQNYQYQNQQYQNYQPNYNQNVQPMYPPNNNYNNYNNMNNQKKKNKKNKNKNKNKSSSSSSSSSSETAQLIAAQETIDSVASFWTLWCFIGGLCTWICFLFAYSYSRRSSQPGVRMLGSISLGLFAFYFTCLCISLIYSLS